MKAVRIVIHGKVQGVFFRKYTKEKAEQLGIKGLVRNLSNGTVEVIAEADDEILETFLKWCHTGSPSSKVDKVEINWVPSGDYSDFKIK
jgi:acylphosphatase